MTLSPVTPQYIQGRIRTKPFKALADNTEFGETINVFAALPEMEVPFQLMKNQDSLGSNYLLYQGECIIRGMPPVFGTFNFKIAISSSTSCDGAKRRPGRVNSWLNPVNAGLNVEFSVSGLTGVEGGTESGQNAYIATYIKQVETWFDCDAWPIGRWSGLGTKPVHAHAVWDQNNPGLQESVHNLGNGPQAAIGRRSADSLTSTFKLGLFVHKDATSTWNCLQSEVRMLYDFSIPAQSFTEDDTARIPGTNYAVNMQLLTGTPGGFLSGTSDDGNLTVKHGPCETRYAAVASANVPGYTLSPVHVFGSSAVNLTDSRGNRSTYSVEYDLDEAGNIVSSGGSFTATRTSGSYGPNTFTVDCTYLADDEYNIERFDGGTTGNLTWTEPLLFDWDTLTFSASYRLPDEDIPGFNYSDIDFVVTNTPTFTYTISRLADEGDTQWRNFFQFNYLGGEPNYGYATFVGFTGSSLGLVKTAFSESDEEELSTFYTGNATLTGNRNETPADVSGRVKIVQTLDPNEAIHNRRVRFLDLGFPIANYTFQGPVGRQADYMPDLERGDTLKITYPLKDDLEFEIEVIFEETFY